MLASFSKECALKVTKIELEVLTDVYMILDYGNGIRGGIARAIYHNDEANYKYLHGYDETKEKKTFNMLILTISADGLYHNHFLVVRVVMLKKYQCLCIILLNTNQNSDFGYTLKLLSAIFD